MEPRIVRDQQLSSHFLQMVYAGYFGLNTADRSQNMYELKDLKTLNASHLLRSKNWKPFLKKQFSKSEAYFPSEVSMRKKFAKAWFTSMYVH